MGHLLSNSTIQVSFLFSAALFLFAIVPVIRLLIELFRFSGETRTLTDDLSQASFSESGRLQQAANSIVFNLREAANSRESLLLLDLDRKLNTLRGIVAGRLAQARALAGILILSGLLATLWNLRASVYQLEMAFNDIKEYSLRLQNAEQRKRQKGEQTAESPAPNRSRLIPGKDKQDAYSPDEQIASGGGVTLHGGGVTLSPASRNRASDLPPLDHSRLPAGMANVAASAVVAFASSFFAILLACLILLTASGTQTKAAASLRRFAEWVYQRYEAALAQTSTGDQSQSLAKLASAVDRFVDSSAGFDKLATELNRLNAFGDKFDQAATAIQDSVNQLPGQVNLSFQGLSQEVATGIAGELRNVIEHIGRLYAIFASQELRLKHINDFMEQLVQSNSGIAGSIHQLSSLPEEIRALVEVVRGTNRATTELKPMLTDLDLKVARLPVASLEEAAETVKHLQEQLGPVEQQLQLVMNDLQSLLKGWRAEIGGALGGLVERFEQLQSGTLQDIKTTLETANFGEAHSMLKSVEQNVTSMSALLPKIRERLNETAYSEQDRSKLKDTLTSIEAHLRIIEEISGRTLLERWFSRGARSTRAGR